MNFFEHQDKARRQTRWLVFLFALAVIGIILAVNMVVLAVLGVENLGTQAGFVQLVSSNGATMGASTLVTGSALTEPGLVRPGQCTISGVAAPPS